MATRISHILLH